MNTASLSSREDKMEAFGRLCTIMDDLRTQCPWDRKQTMESLRILTIEETYELSDAILSQNSSEIREELGDLMLHLVFYARIAEELGQFTLPEAIHGICEKLIKRHPHIYADVVVNDENDVKRNWEQLKLAEGKKSVLSGVPASLPAMVKAYRMQEKTAQVGFEWAEKEPVWEKVMEEIQEFKEAETNSSLEHQEEEFGDILFSLINYARFAGINPETALEKVNRKFKRRFEYIETNAPRPLQDMTLEEMDTIWNEAKLNNL